MEIVQKENKEYLKIILNEGETLISEESLQKFLNQIYERKVFNSLDELNFIHGNKYISVNRIQFVSLMLKFEETDSRRILAEKIYQRGTKKTIAVKYIPITASEYKKLFSKVENKPSWKKRR